VQIYLTAFVVEFFLLLPTTMVTSSPLLLLPESSKAKATDGLAAVDTVESGGWEGTSMAEWPRLMALSFRSIIPLDGGGGGTKCPGTRAVFLELLR
jgi:hypothetical protein